ncbi:phosphogluconate dehydrogenase [Citrobacter koseri]|nr:phosphogluconate dehydrogenase [Citrobacter koseri]
MGIRVKLINNYMSIALNALSAEAAALCEALGLSFDVALKVMERNPGRQRPLHHLLGPTKC